MSTPTTIALAGCAFAAVQLATTRIGLRLGKRHGDEAARLQEPNRQTGRPETLRQIENREMRWTYGGKR